MTICAISDTHGRHTQLDMAQYPADVLIHAGDWTRGRDLGLSETMSFLHWFSAQPYKHKICIAGNHEMQVEALDSFRDLVAEKYPGITYLQDDACEIDGIRFYGSPYSNQFYDWAFMEEDSALAPIWAAIPDDTEVLITHGPAYGTHDRVDRPTTDPHVGSTTLRDRLAQLPRLQLHISGHIHEARGITTHSTFTSICPSILGYRLVNEPILFTLGD